MPNYQFGNRNEGKLNPTPRIYWRASLVPAAAVIPAPRAYIKVAAVKKLVVGCRRSLARRSRVLPAHPSGVLWLASVAAGLHRSAAGLAVVTLSKLECSKQAFAVDTLAWNNGTGLWPVPLVCRTGVMMKRNSRGHSYFVVRGEILGFTKDEPLRKHLPRMFSLIKNESWGLEDD